MSSCLWNKLPHQIKDSDIFLDLQQIVYRRR